MEINTAPIPAVPDVRPEPPRDAATQNAVRESQPTEPEKNETQSDTGGREQDTSSSLGRHINEKV